MVYLFYLGVSILLMLFYFSLARNFNIVDQPNHRSSHSRPVILGAGVLFPSLLLIHFILTDFAFPFFISGLIIVSIISFYDDLKPLSNKLRLFCHLCGVSLMFYEAETLSFSPLIIIAVYVLAIGTINAYNFMDGINGLTVSYSLVTTTSLYYINEKLVSFINSEWLLVCMIALSVTSFFNFRRDAKCFVGDIGSVSMAYIIIFFIILLIVKTQDLKYIALLLVYGLDSVTTIIFRIIRNENIFEAHRSHFYQYLSNILQWPHLAVSMLYAVVQMTINTFILGYSFSSITFIILVVVSGIMAVAIRLFVEGKAHLLKKHL